MNYLFTLLGSTTEDISNLIKNHTKISTKLVPVLIIYYK